MADEITLYSEYLAEVKHSSQNTICSYVRDVSQFDAYLRNMEHCSLEDVTHQHSFVLFFFYINNIIFFISL